MLYKTTEDRLAELGDEISFIHNLPQKTRSELIRANNESKALENALEQLLIEARCGNSDSRQCQEAFDSAVASAKQALANYHKENPNETHTETD